MDYRFNPQVGDRVTTEVMRVGQASVGFAGMVKRIDPSEEYSHLVQLDEPVEWMLNRSLIWFRPQDLDEEYLD